MQNEDEEEFAFSEDQLEHKSMNLEDLLEKESRQDNENSHLDIIHQIRLGIINSEPCDYYYYKRWVWMNFAWLTQYRNTKPFSQQVNCIETNEFGIGSLYMKCLAIVFEQKLKKQNVMKKKSSTVKLPKILLSSKLTKSVNNTMKFNTERSNKSHFSIANKALTKNNNNNVSQLETVRSILEKSKLQESKLMKQNKLGKQ